MKKNEDYTIKVHVLKCHNLPFEEKWKGKKPWELRKNDRNFKVGELIDEREFLPLVEEYTGRIITERIEYILKEGFGLPEGYCIMTTKEIYRYGKDF